MTCHRRVADYMYCT